MLDLPFHLKPPKKKNKTQNTFLKMIFRHWTSGSPGHDSQERENIG
jgi:hypothetical protein